MGYNHNSTTMKHTIIACLSLAVGLASCSDFFDVESKSVIDADANHLTNATDTVYSIAGIFAQMGTLTDRTILLGEARGDLVDVTDVTSSDLRDVAQFNIGDDNQYNRPKDYYAVINNCNYFIARADTTMKDNRNNYIFKKEYVMAKTYRAWTYLQLALNYGRVPFVEKPILTKEESERDYPRYDIKTLCDWLIKDLQGLDDVQLTGYGDIGGVNSRYFIIPVDLMLGELNLWAEHYREAASAYYRYLSRANGLSKGTPIGTYASSWSETTTTYQNNYSDGYSSVFFGSNSSEQIFTMRSDSLPSQPNYSQLYAIFNTNSDNDYKASLVPSQAIIDLSRNQTYCQPFKSGNEYLFVYPPKNNTSYYTDGDLRLASVWSHTGYINYNGQRLPQSSIWKYNASSRRIMIYRNIMVYLRMIEALNRAGFPRMAYCFLSRGTNNDTIARYVKPYYPADEAYINSFSFSKTIYKANVLGEASGINMIGIHDRGCGWSAANKDYQLPAPADSCSGADSTAYQIPLVEDMIVNECALELAFEGTRFYDLMRVALRRGDPSYLANRIKARRGENTDAGIQKDLTVKDNWYMKLK